MQESLIKQQINYDQTKPQARDKILWTFWNFTPSRKTCHQIRAIKEIEDLQCF